MAAEPRQLVAGLLVEWYIGASGAAIRSPSAARSFDRLLVASACARVPSPVLF